jgi:hypothetical protein
VRTVVQLSKLWTSISRAQPMTAPDLRSLSRSLETPVESVHRAKIFGRCEVKSGIAPVYRLVSEVMSQEPYKSARRVFWT